MAVAITDANSLQSRDIQQISHSSPIDFKFLGRDTTEKCTTLSKMVSAIDQWEINGRKSFQD